MTLKIRLRQPAFIYLTAFLLGMQLTDPSRVWMILLVTMAGACLFAYAWTFFLGRSLQLRRERRVGWVQAGSQIEERFTVSNPSYFPALWLEFKDNSTLPGYNPSATLSLKPGEFIQWTAPGFCDQRGLYYLGDASLITGDPFGIFEITAHDATRTSLIVLPQVTELPKMQVSPAGFFGEGKPRLNSLQKTVNSMAVREYQSADSLHLIHWPTTARMNQAFVKLMENASEGSWWILLDLDQRAMLGSGWDSVEEQSVSLAASLADFGLLARKSVGLISNSTPPSWIVPKKDDAQRWEILHALALVRPSQQTLAHSLTRLNPALGRNHSLLIITASLDPTWMQNLVSLKVRGMTPSVFLMDPITFGDARPAKLTAERLQEQGIICHIIPRGMIQPPKRQEHGNNSWLWRQTAQGTVPIALSGAKRGALK